MGTKRGCTICGSPETERGLCTVHDERLKRAGAALDYGGVVSTIALSTGVTVETADRVLWGKLAQGIERKPWTTEAKSEALQLFTALREDAMGRLRDIRGGERSTTRAC